MLTYTITEGQLVQLFHGRPQAAWNIPAPPCDIARVFVEDMGGHCFCDAIELDDGRVILVSVEGPVHDENGGQFACIYSSLDAAYNGEENNPLSIS